MFFQLFSTIKITCGWNDRKCVFMCYFTCEARKMTIYLGKIQDGDGSASITSNLLVRSPQPKRLDSSILFSLVKLVFFFLARASIYWQTDGHNWARCSKHTGYQAWVRNYILATCRACSTEILLDSCRVFLKYAKIQRTKKGSAGSERRRDIFKQIAWNFRIHVEK